MESEVRLSQFDVLSNPHFLVTGAQTTRSVELLLRSCEAHVDIVIIGTRDGCLYQTYGRKAEDARSLGLGVKVLDEPTGRAIGIAALLRAHDEACAVAGKDAIAIAEGRAKIHQALERSEQERMQVGWGEATENGRRYVIEPGPIDVEAANAHLHALGLPSLIELGGETVVVLKDPRMGLGLAPYGVRPKVRAERREAERMRRCIALREAHPHAERSVIEEVANDEMADQVWELAELQTTSQQTERNDSYGCGLLDAVEFEAQGFEGVLKPYHGVIHGLIDGATPLGGFLTGGIRYLDVSACSDDRTSLVILGLLNEMQHQQFRGRWRLLVLDVPVALLNATVWSAAQDVVRQGRKHGLGTLFIEPDPQERICAAIRGDLGNVIGGGKNPQELGFAPVAQDAEILGLASTLKMELERRWRHVAPDQAQPISQHFYSLQLGAFTEHDDFGLLWKSTAESEWTYFPTPDAVTNRSKISHTEWLTITKHVYYLYRRLLVLRQSYPKASFWWNNISDGVSYALSSWK